MAWSVAPGRIAEDTKNDLYVDAWGFLARSLHLWDPQVTWGGLSNQGYGYLFPMGPFFAVGSELAPVWVVQRVWWSALLTAGFLGMAGLLRALGVGTRRTRLVGSLAYVLAPRVVSSIGGLSAEIQPQMLAPLVVWPLVAASRGRLSTGRAATLSGLAALLCGGVNATATLCALVPAGLWLVTRHRWWRSPLTWGWSVAVLAATAWWLGPLLVMARYVPPFLDWIENARAVTRPIGMLDVVRGTTHWLGHVVTPGGPWWPAGHELATSRNLIVLTSGVAGLGLAGLALGRVPERRWLWTSLVVGGVLLCLAHSGPLSSPLVDEAQAALDGPLAPLRNIHKLDLLVRLPLAVGLAHLLGRLAHWRPAREWHRPLVMGAVALTVVCAAAPGFTGSVAVRGSFERIPQHWVDAGRWLDTHRDEGQALVLPAANFGEYSWGRTIDEPLRPLTSAAYAVRDAVPFAPAGTIRLLDEVERRLQSGRSLDGGADVLLRAGIRHLVVRNDLDTQQSGQPPVAFARSSVRATPGVRFTRGFGQSFIDSAGERVFPVEVYDLTGRTSESLELWPVRGVTGASGASEDLLRLADVGLLTGPVVFDGDRTGAVTPQGRVDTDGMRMRQRWFGAPRGQDLTSTLTEAEGLDAPDYLPWTETSLRSSVTYQGIDDVEATSSMAVDLGFAGLRPAHRPFAALDGDPATSWTAMWDEHPRLTVDLTGPTTFDHVLVTGAGPDAALGSALSRPTRVRVTTDRGSATATLGTGATRVGLPPGAHTQVSVEVLATEEETPGSVVTGLSELAIPGVRPAEVIRLPEPAPGATAPEAVVLGSGLRGRDGCTTTPREFVCIGGQAADPEQSGELVREVPGRLPGTWEAGGSLAHGGSEVPAALTGSPDVSVEASSVRSDAPQARPDAIVDGDDRTAWSPAFDDETPEITFRFARSVTVSTVRLQTRRDWAERASPAVVINIGGREFTRRVQAGGVVDIPATSGSRLHLTFVRVPGSTAVAAPNAALELEAVTLDGLTFAPPQDRVVARCGEGPSLVVDGRKVPTSASLTRDELFGLGSGSWTACEDVRFGPGASHHVEVGTWHGLTAGSAVLRNPASRPAAEAPVSLSPRRDGTTWTADVTPVDQGRLLVMDQNANAGWEARLDGAALRPQVVDGRRQGFVIPADVAGPVTITFGPDSTYRGALAVGLALAVALVVATALLLRPGSRGVPPAEVVAARGPLAVTTRRSWLPVLLAVVIGGLLAGPVGAGAAMFGAAVSVLLRRRPGARLLRPALVVAGVVAAALVQAALSPGSLGGPVLEGAMRVVLIAVVALAAVSPSSEDPRSDA